MPRTLFIALVTFFTLQSTAQTIHKCATDEMWAESVKQNPELIKQREAADAIAQQNNTLVQGKSAQIRYIPVVFHIIHKNGFENISQAQIMDQIRILNEDFRKKPGTNGGKSTNALAADMEIEFRLAQYDPWGNKSDGINRIYNPNFTDNANNGVKGLAYWDSEKYLNIWVVNTIAAIGGVSGTVLGYAQFPWDRQSKPTTDGIVIRADQVGTVGTGRQDQAGRTLTHEVGHWIGLYHTFQGGCFGQGDGVADTPPVAAASSGCNKGQNSCSSDVPNLPDQIENYMDYSDGTCMELFTTGQKSRVHSILNQYRTFLYNNNPTYAGFDGNGNYLPVAASIYTAPITFTFDGADPAAGLGFRYQNLHNNVNNTANPYGWAYNGSTGYMSAGCLSMLNFNNTTAMLNSRDGFITPEINFALVASPFIEFYYAYTQKSSVNFDSLCVFASSNFGMTEERIFGETGSGLATSPVQATAFIPGSSSQWRKVSVNLWRYHLKPNVRFRFEFFNRRGNNVYVDQISFSNGSTGSNEQWKEAVNFEFGPNPFHSNAQLSFELKEKQFVKILLIDLLGREVKNVYNGILNSGKTELNIDKEGLMPGVYNLQFEAGEQRFTHKLLIN